MNQFAALHFNTLNSCHHLIWSFMIFLHSPNKLSEEKHPTIKKHLCLGKIQKPIKNTVFPTCALLLWMMFRRVSPRCPITEPKSSVGTNIRSFSWALRRAREKPSRKSSTCGGCFTIRFQLWPDHLKFHAQSISISWYLMILIWFFLFQGCVMRFHDCSLASTSTTPSSSEDIRSSIFFTIMTITPSYPPIHKNIATRSSCLEAKSSRTWFRTHWPFIPINRLSNVEN